MGPRAWQSIIGRLILINLVTYGVMEKEKNNDLKDIPAFNHHVPSH